MYNTKFTKIAYFSVGLIIVFAFSAFLINKNLQDPRFTGPKIEFVTEKISLGDVKVGPKVEGEFEFKNVGKDILIIQNIQPSCGCTGVVVDEKKEFLTGETGKIKFTFNTEGRMGVNEKTISVTSNDALTPTKLVSFTCNVVQ